MLYMRFMYVCMHSALIRTAYASKDLIFYVYIRETIVPQWSEYVFVVVVVYFVLFCFSAVVKMVESIGQWCYMCVCFFSCESDAFKHFCYNLIIQQKFTYSNNRISIQKRFVRFVSNEMNILA